MVYTSESFFFLHTINAYEEIGGGGRTGGGETEDGNVREHGSHGAQELVVRPEVVTPLGTAVDLVYSQPDKPSRLVEFL